MIRFEEKSNSAKSNKTRVGPRLITSAEQAAEMAAGVIREPGRAGFDKTAYQRDYMRKRRAKAKSS